MGSWVGPRTGLDVVAKRKIEAVRTGSEAQGTMEIEAAGSSETSILTYRTTRYHKPRRP
jgi:hypothetical protein